MADTVREKLVSAICTGLLGLDLGGAGTTKRCRRDYRPHLLEGVELPYANVLDFEENEEDQGRGDAGPPQGFVECTLRLDVWAVMRVKPSKDVDPSVTINEALGNLKKRLKELGNDGGALRAISGFNWLHITGNTWTPLMDGKSIMGIRVDASVMYYHKVLDPFVGRA